MDNDLTITAINTAANYAGNALRTGANPRIYADGDITINSSGKLSYTSNQAFLNINPGKTLSINFDGTASFTTSLGDPNGSIDQGNLVIQSFQQPSFTSAFSSSNWTFNNNLSGLTVGKETNTSSVTLAESTSIAGPISIYGGSIAVNAPLTATNSTISITSSTSIIDGASGYLIADGLALNGAGTVTLDHTSNDINTIAAGSSSSPIGALSYTDADDLTIGSVNPTGIYSSGEIELSTLLRPVYQSSFFMMVTIDTISYEKVSVLIPLFFYSCSAMSEDFSEQKDRTKVKLLIFGLENFYNFFTIQIVTKSCTVLLEFRYFLFSRLNYLFDVVDYK